MVTGPFAVLHTVAGAPERSTAVPRTATGPTFTPQIVAATCAATPMFALSRTETSPSETLTRPFCCELFAAATGPATHALSAAVANSAAPIFLIGLMPLPSIVSLRTSGAEPSPEESGVPRCAGLKRRTAARKWAPEPQRVSGEGHGTRRGRPVQRIRLR